MGRGGGVRVGVRGVRIHDEYYDNVVVWFSPIQEFCRRHIVKSAGRLPRFAILMCIITEVNISAYYQLYTVLWPRQTPAPGSRHDSTISDYATHLGISNLPRRQKPSQTATYSVWRSSARGKLLPSPPPFLPTSIYLSIHLSQNSKKVNFKNFKKKPWTSKPLIEKRKKCW